jgi:hypothetical protein
VIAALVLLLAGATAAHAAPPEPTDAVPSAPLVEPVPAESPAAGDTVVPESPPPAAGDTVVPESPPPAAGEPAPKVPTPEPVGPKAVPTEAAIARDSRVTPIDRSRKSRIRGTARTGTKQRFAVEFKIGPYLPEVDSRYKGAGFGPYATIFGRTNSRGETVKKPKLGVMPIVAFEWQFAYLAGPLGIGTQIGFLRDTADALVAEPVAGESVRSRADTVRFGMVPLALLATYRFELVADYFKVPLVPYIKAGVAYSFWWIKDGTKKVAVNQQGEKGRGGVIGWQMNPGIMLRLDFIERGSAKKLDVSTGINHTYIFGEFQLSRLRNFGVGNSIDLGDKTFFGGLAIEF